MRRAKLPGIRPNGAPTVNRRRGAICLALAVLVAIISWQILTVRYQYGGNSTGLFWIGPQMPVPDALRGEKLYLFQGILGYDGQIFHLMAHDPWMRRGVYQSFVGSGYRYQRILIPALAWMLALGHDRWIDAVYIAVIDIFLCFGVYAAARLAQRSGLAALWGLSFVINPGSIASMDRMTVDGPFLALGAAVLLLAEETVTWRTAALLAAATLTREVGALLILACFTAQFTKRHYRGCMWAAGAALPYMAWRTYVLNHTPIERVTTYMRPIPLYGFFDRWLHGPPYPLPPLENMFAVVGDYAAMAGMTVALGIAVAAAWKRRWGTLPASMYAFTLLMMFLSARQIWVDAYAFGRAFAPLLFFVALVELPARPWLAITPAGLVALRMSMNSVKPLLSILRGVSGA